MKGLSLKVKPDYAGGVRAFTEGRGRTVLRESSSLTIPARTLTLADSCLRRRCAEPAPPRTRTTSSGPPGC